LGDQVTVAPRRAGFEAGGRRAALRQEIHPFGQPVQAGHDGRQEQQEREIALHETQVPGAGVSGERREHRGREERHHSSTCKMARNASWGTSTEPICFILFLPAFCFSRSLRLRVMSPPQHFASTFLRRALIVSRAMTLAPIAAWIATSNICRLMILRIFVTTARPRYWDWLRCTMMDR